MISYRITLWYYKIKDKRLKSSEKLTIYKEHTKLHTRPLQKTRSKAF